jgi:hypothetical protein
MKRLSNRTSKLLGVKMDPEAFENLLVESAVRKLTVSELVRELITNHQNQGAQSEGLKEQVRKLREEVRTMQKELGLVAEIILLHALKIPKDQAREWVVKTFKFER